MHSYDIPGAIAVIDFGGQYAHLIASKLRKLGAYSEIFLPHQFPASYKPGFHKGIILSGGPASVYDPDSPKISAAIFDFRIPVLGICYGHQYLIHTLGGEVAKAEKREYGRALLSKKNEESLLLQGVSSFSVVWMSHSDEVVRLPEGFLCTASTDDCVFAAVEHPGKQIFGVQFHPEVSHTEEGEKILKNFISLCHLENTWDLKNYLETLKEFIKEKIKNKKIFFLVSGGVDSTVAYTLLYRISDDSQVKGYLIDTGFLRKNEVENIKKSLDNLGIHITIKNEKDRFFEHLKQVVNPEAKRNIIGELFIRIQKEIIEELHLQDEEWMIGQGTIYPDTIESGATRHSQTIKTHHNRVPVIQELLEKGNIIEPLVDFYKDEVREIGKMLGLPADILYRHPFPGPGLAVRCLCNDGDEGSIEPAENYLPEDLRKTLQSYGAGIFLLPVKSVGVQGDRRTYARPAVLEFRNGFRGIDWDGILELARNIINKFEKTNRALLYLPPERKNTSLLEARLAKAKYLTEERIALLQEIDDTVMSFLKRKEIYGEIWQFPVVMIPVVDSQGRESIVLRPVVSENAMTASVYTMNRDILYELVNLLYSTDLVAYVFYDVTTKPPGTIEWE